MSQNQPMASEEQFRERAKEQAKERGWFVGDLHTFQKNSNIKREVVGLRS